MIGKKVLATAILLTLLAACGEASPGKTIGPTKTSGGEWSELPRSPLTARRSAHAFSVGGKLLIMGGTEAEPCPPAADCIEPTEAPQSDSASYDPSAGTWKSLAEAPVPLGFGTGAVAGGRVYLLLSEYGSSHPSLRRAFLSYDPEQDEWTELEAPPKDPSLILAAAGDDVVAFQESQENGITGDLIFDTSSGTWSELPPDPLRTSFDRSMVWTDAGLVLLGIENVPNPGADGPALYRAAVLDDSGDWKRLPDSQVIGWNPNWSFSAGRVVNGSIESADGGEVNGWDRSYPAGGMLDPKTGEWTELQGTPKEHGGLTGIYAMGNRGVVAGGGWVFDASSERWLNLTRPEGAPETEAAAAWVADELFVWGGARYRGSSGELLSEGWSWQPNW